MNKKLEKLFDEVRCKDPQCLTCKDIKSFVDTNFIEREECEVQGVPLKRIDGLTEIIPVLVKKKLYTHSQVLEVIGEDKKIAEEGWDDHEEADEARGYNARGKSALKRLEDLSK